MPMARTNEILRGQLDAYTEAWKRPHAEAMEYWDLREALHFSLALYDAITSLGEYWSGEVHAGRQPFDRAAAMDLERMYRAWDAPTGELRRGIRASKAAGFTLDDESRFGAACDDVRLKLAMNLDEIIKAEVELRDGRGIPLAEVRDGLRRRRLVPGE